MEVTRLPQVATLDNLIQELHRVFDSDEVNVEYVHNLLASYKSNPIEWKKFAKFDRYKYTRNLVDEGNGKFNLMLLCWGPSHTSTIHDHADAHCFMKMLAGSLQEVRFEWPKEEEEAEQNEQGMVEIDRNILKTNGVCYINDSLGLHRVENASHSENAVSLHLYCPPFSACQIFDEMTGKKRKCPVTFWSKFGKKVEHGPPK
ncbi:cysteine dioxygenase type 1-like [Penaeus japonicus]|uniref:cysteine dioxygenase type 1-like n=1 Tax=Penaeus japonicus TaxID=27405 RepID=UPI001C712F48|nr:cysteine dioxygenase type 1-like [Penaeus japonicus]